MRRALLLVTTVLLIFGSVMRAQATTFYVNPGGNDSNNGTAPTAAWKTVQRVNSQSLKPGDAVLFLAGSTYPGNLYLDPSDRGSASALVEIGSYGTGRATIAAGTGNGVLMYNASYFYIHDLNVVGAGFSTNTGDGILAYADLGGNVLLDTIRIDQVEASGFGNYGLTIGAYNAMTGFRHVRITNAYVHDNRKGGLITYAYQPYVHQDVYVGYTRAVNNPGISGVLYNTGNGITMSGVNGGTIEYSVAHDNGWLNNYTSGPIGIWAYDSSNVTIQYSESYNNRTGGTKDGGGFALDQNSMNCVMQYNYSHGNAGSGYLLSHKPDNFNFTGDVVRYNVSENDGRRNNYGAFHVWGRIWNTEVYNNSFYVAATSTGAPRAVYIKNTSILDHYVHGLHIRNNIFQTTGGVRAVEITSAALVGAVDLRFEGNMWYGTGYAAKYVWGSVSYSGLAAWRTGTGEERLNGQAVGAEANPKFLKPGAGVTVESFGNTYRLESFRLDPTSPAINTGLNLTNLFGIDPGSRDYHLASIPIGSGYDVGAYEFDVACGWSVSPTSASVPAAGGSIALNVTTNNSACGWTTTSRAAWMTPGPPSTGMGSGGVTVSVAANTGNSRASTLLVGLQTINVSQGGVAQVTSSDDVVLYASQSAINLTGNWSLASDSTAASGARVQQANAGQAKIAAPLASPVNYFEVTFNAVAGKPYHLWMRGKALSNYYGNDSVYIQFDQSVDANGAAVGRIGTTDGYTYNLEDCSGCGLSGWGWQDNGYGTNVMGPNIYFATTGTVRMRVQQREDGLGIDQIILSPSTWLTASPGALKNDTTIVPQP